MEDSFKHLIDTIIAREVLDLALDGKISKINKKLDWRHLVTESMKPKNQQNQEKSFVN